MPIHNKHFITGAAALGLMVGAALAAASPLTTAHDGARARHDARAAQRQALHDPHGADDALEIVPMFDSLSESPAGASGVFHIEVDNYDESALRVAYAWQLSNDTGAVLASGSGPTVGEVQPDGFYASEQWQAPGLTDGFYRVTITMASAASDDQERSSVMEHDWWLKVTGGELSEISASEWEASAPGAQQATRIEE